MRTVQEIHPVFNIPVEFVPCEELARELMPRVLPPHWKGPQDNGHDGLVYHYSPPFGRTLLVLVSAERESDGRLWLHVSVSKRNPSGTTRELPDWDDMRKVKDLFVGRARYAYMVLPPSEKHVNLGEVHHLWCCLDGPALPDFTHGTGSI